jgi:hypothetical protein
LVTIPGLANMVVVIGLNLFGDGLRETLDSRPKKLLTARPAPFGQLSATLADRLIVCSGHAAVHAFAKNAGLGFAVPYLHNGQMHEYVPDFLVRLDGESPRYLILETKGFDQLEEVKRAAAERWVAAVNAEGTYGTWCYRVAKKVADIDGLIGGAASDMG